MPASTDSAANSSTGVFGERLTVTAADGSSVEYARADTLTAAQDDLASVRRVLALVNAWRVTPDRTEATLQRLLAAAGYDDAAGQAMRSVVASFRPDFPTGPR